MGLLGALIAAQALAPSQLELAREFERAVDRPTPKARREAARCLAARKEITLESRLAAAEYLGRFAHDDAGSRVLEAELQVLDAIEATALLRVRRSAPDLYEVTEERHVAAFRLLLADGLFAAEAPLRVRRRGEESQKTPEREARVLLEDFVECFDRRHLPVVELRSGSRGACGTSVATSAARSRRRATRLRLLSAVAARARSRARVRASRSSGRRR